MNTDWSAFLSNNAAVIEDGVVRHFGDPAAELSSASRGAIVSDLSQFGVLFFHGADASTFLQGQLSCDVGAIPVDGCSYGSYCTAKGRVLATFLLWRTDAGYFMALSRDILAATQKRLSMYVLRSKVKLEDLSDRMVLIGLTTPVGTGGLSGFFSALPESDKKGVRSERGLLLRLAPARWLLVSDVVAAQQAWQDLLAVFSPVGAPAWSWLEIHAGIPWVTLPTQDQFVPQMLNLELIGGVSFQKGCYPGQEIVARTQYLGKLKRRMYLANIASGDAPSAGMALYSEALGDQASGMIVNAQASPSGGFDVLAVSQAESIDNSAVHAGSLDGPALSILTLPYALP
jgi:folate-binding protein YgfZ